MSCCHTDISVSPLIKTKIYIIQLKSIEGLKIGITKVIGTALMDHHK